MIGLRSAIAALVLAWQTPGVAEGQEQPDPLISVDVNLVLLHASVHDRRGRDVPNLEERAFKLYEDGVRQDIQLFRHEDAPVTLGLIIDHSGSMAPKLGEVAAAARMLAQSSNPDDQMFVVNFNERVSPGVLVDPQAKGTTGLEAALASLPAEGQTALYDAIASGLNRLSNGHWAKKVLVVISDGGDNASSHKLAEVARLAEQSSVVIYTIGIYDENDPDAEPSILKRLAAETGGEAYFPKQTSNTREICDHIARDIRTQYMIGYVSNSEKRGDAYRSVQLAEAPGAGKLRVRTRSGYIPWNGARRER